VVDGTTVKNRPTLVKTQPVVQLAWLGLGGKESSALQERGEEDANVTCEGGKRERDRELARKRGRERERERERESFFPLECSNSFIIAMPMRFTISTVVSCSTCLV
jgi:hypothetical protein